MEGIPGKILEQQVPVKSLKRLLEGYHLQVISFPHFELNQPLIESRRFLSRNHKQQGHETSDLENNP